MNVFTNDSTATGDASYAYWKSLYSLFIASIIIIFFIVLYVLTDKLSESCGENDQLSIISFILKKDCENEPSIFIITIAAGCLGAIFSNIIRIFQFDQASPAFIQRIAGAGLMRMIVYTMVPVVIGAVAAAIVYLIFAAKFLQGVPFPNFTCPTGDPCEGVDALINLWGPDKAEDYAKVIFWGFVVGFSERLIPDMLGQYSRLIESKLADISKVTKQVEIDTKAAVESARLETEKAAARAKDTQLKADEAQIKAAKPDATEQDKSYSEKATQTALESRKIADSLKSTYEKIRI